MNSSSKLNSDWRLVFLVGVGMVVSNPYGSPESLNFVYSQLFPAGNLLANGSFEGNYSTIDFPGWMEGAVHDPAAYKQLQFSDVVSPHGGRNFAGIRFAPPTGSSRFLVADAFPVKPGTWYTFFVYYRNIDYSTAAGSVFPTFATFKDRRVLEGGSLVSFPTASHGRGGDYGAASAWTGYAHRFYTGAAANFANVALLSAEAASAGGAFMFDDAFLVEGCVRAYEGEPLPATCSDDVTFGRDGRHPDFIANTQKFFDGDEKLIQTSVQDGPRDIVAEIIYDELGRPMKKTLPIGAEFPSSRHQFVPGITGWGGPGDLLSEYYDPSKDVFLDDEIAGTVAKYPDAGGIPYSETAYERSKLNRVLETAGPGARWAMGTGHTTRFLYTSVSSLDAADDATLPDPEVTTATEEFSVKETTGPDGQVSREFMDRQGKLVRTSSKLGVEWVITDYRFDEAGNPVSILSPEDPDGNRLSTHMTHNTLGQLTSETTSSTGTTQFQYDAQGKIRFSQTANQAAATKAGVGRFSYVKYDALGRVFQRGEITDASLFSPANAERPEFPCVANCEDPAAEVDPSLIRIRAVSQYDNEGAVLSCSAAGNGGTPGQGDGDFQFIAKDPGGTVVAAADELVQTYEEAVAQLQGQSGMASVLVRYDPLGELEVVPRPGSEITPVGSLDFTLEAVAKDSPEGDEVLGEYLAFLTRRATTLLGPGEFLHGRLVKTLSCNYELAEALGEQVPREVSKTCRYDKYGNVTRVLEVNNYAHISNNRVHLWKNRYDVQNRLVERIACADLTIDPDCNGSLVHKETYSYDRLGRIDKVEDKAGGAILANHYNYIGQLSAKGSGASINATTGNGLLEKFDYNAHGWRKTAAVSRQNPVGELFRSELDYEKADGSGRFDGSISTANYGYASGTSVGSIQYEYSYDDLNRLTASDVDPPSMMPEGSSSYDYLDDGRLAMMSRGSRVGQYAYYTNGRLKEVEGDLVEERDMRLTSHDNLVFDYDENGNLVTDKSKQEDDQPLEIIYRPDNLPYMITLKKPRAAGGGYDDLSIYMTYDEGGRRVTKTQYRGDAWESSKNYFSSGKEVREIGSESAVTSLEIYGLAGAGRVTYDPTKPEGYKEFYMTDHLGSTRQAYDFTTGELTYASHYFPYGKPLSEFVSTDKGDERMSHQGITERFTGKEIDDELDLMYFGARYFDADLGMWINPDPARQFASPYSYGPNPVNSIDPDGRIDLIVNESGQHRVENSPLVETHYYAEVSAIDKKVELPSRLAYDAVASGLKAFQDINFCMSCDAYGINIQAALIPMVGPMGGVNLEYFKQSKEWALFWYAGGGGGWEASGGVSLNMAWYRQGNKSMPGVPSTWEGIFFGAQGSYGNKGPGAFIGLPGQNSGVWRGVSMGVPYLAPGIGGSINATGYTQIK